MEPKLEEFLARLGLEHLQMVLLEHDVDSYKLLESLTIDQLNKELGLSFGHSVTLRMGLDEEKKKNNFWGWVFGFWPGTFGLYTI